MLELERSARRLREQLPQIRLCGRWPASVAASRLDLSSDTDPRTIGGQVVGRPANLLGNLPQSLLELWRRS